MEDYTSNEEQQDYTLSDPALTTFIIQPGFVEPYTGEKSEFEDPQESFTEILSSTREQLMFLWNGIPVSLDYPVTVASHLSSILDFLEPLVQSPSQSTELKITTSFGKFDITAAPRDEDRLLLRISMKDSQYALQSALNDMELIVIERSVFLSEWKMLLQQLLEAFLRSGVKVRNISQVERLYAINQNIEHFGQMYDYLNPPQTIN